MTQSSQPQKPTPLQLRAKLEKMVRQDLLGPKGGPEEEIRGRRVSVRGRYIVGLLAPRGQSLLPDEQDDLSVDGAGDAQDGKTDTAVPQTASFLPSSLGLTFAVDGAARSIQVTARWGRYDQVISETHEDDEGRPEQVWKRRPVEGVSPPIPLRAGDLGPWRPEPDLPDVYVRGRCRRRGKAWTVTLFLVNAQQEPKAKGVSKDPAWVFQPELIVQSPDGAPIFIKRHLPPELSSDNPEDRAMQMLYRRELEFAVGHGVAARARLAPGSWQRAVEVRTDVIPTYEVERMEPPSASEVPLLGQALLDMQRLAQLEQGDFGAALDPLAGAYQDWIEEQAARASAPPPDLAVYQADAQTALANCREALERVRAGIALLDGDPLAAEAFRFANRAMHQQRVRSIFASQARQGKKPDIKELDVAKNRSWFPFQLAFVLLNLPALVDPTHPSRSHPTEALADLLWFPTGGGKTEAYLGVAAFAIGMRRLQGELGGRSGQAGVAVLMRYTLRLLTLQQFQRAATLMCACEVIRRADPKRWGMEPFRIGLWVGQRSTPNWTKHAAEAIKRDRGIGWGGGASVGGTPHQLTNCPWCGSPIDPGKNIRVETVEQGRGRTLQYCSARPGQCPFNFRAAPDEGVPIVVVDEEVYRRLPTLLIATVDKFAQMPWKGETGMLFGQVDGYCPRHGYRSPELQDSDSHPKKRNLPAARTQPIGPLRPPDLIIQDELHLISGPLGTLVGLYETAVDRLASWEVDGKLVRPKVIASTATIRRAKDQVSSLFLRRVRVFPPAALDAQDNFFSRRRPTGEQSPGRLYVGVCAPGKRLKAVLIRVYAAYMSAAQVLYNEHGQTADPWMTLVGYFNSMRELGGMRRVVDDAVRTRLQRMEERGLAKRYIDSIDELTSRKKASEIPQILDRLETTFDARRQKRGKKDTGRWPLDVVLATNMISVGVDVSRLGLMVVASQPKATAEYIQATSRVGRSPHGPGLVCAVYNWARPRDLSHYERFEHYHATFYQQVEALSVTPFAPRALDRGLTGVLAALVRLLGPDFNANDGAGQLTREHELVQAALQAIGDRAEKVTGSYQQGEQVRQWLKDRLDQWLNQAGQTSGGAILGYTKRKDGRTLGLLKKPSEKDWDIFTCLNSLRDVEPSVSLILRDYAMDNEPGQAPHETGEEES